MKNLFFFKTKTKEDDVGTDMQTLTKRMFLGGGVEMPEYSALLVICHIRWRVTYLRVDLMSKLPGVTEKRMTLLTPHSLCLYEGERYLLSSELIDRWIDAVTNKLKILDEREVFDGSLIAAWAS